MMAETRPTAETGASIPFYADKGRYPGIWGWLFSTDHKRIGILYLVSIAVFFSAAVVLGVLMRVHMLPGMKLLTAEQYNQFFSLHGIIQIFLVVIPAVPTIFGNFFLPILIGARDMAFPRLNLFTWYLYITGSILVFISVFSGGGAVDAG